MGEQLQARNLRVVAQVMMDEVLNLQGLVGAISANQTEAHKSLRSLQQQVRLLLGATDEQELKRFHASSLVNLVDLVSRLEQGDTEGIDDRELHKALVTLDIGAAKIRNYLGSKKKGQVKADAVAGAV